MRAQYDQRVKHVKENVVPYNGYARYGTFFDRHLDAQEKVKNAKSRGKRKKKQRWNSRPPPTTNPVPQLVR